MENPEKSIPQENVILIDWLTVTLFDVTVEDVQRLLGLDGIDIPWDTRKAFRHGYPCQTSWQNINIRWGADNQDNYTDDAEKSAADKVRYDMGICLDMSGNGCRAYEQYGHGDWLLLLQTICNLQSKVNFTRLDLAYDDHIGILDINRIRRDVEQRNYTGKAKKAMVIWSDDQVLNLQGLTVQIGSKASAVLIRIYDKAAERGFDQCRHWVRVELQLRADRAIAAVAAIVDREDIGMTFSGVLRNYCCMREPVNDENKSRWPVAEYWSALIGDSERIRLWISPGEPYNFRKSEDHMISQYGQWLQTYERIHGTVHDLFRRCKEAHPELSKKYKAAIEDAKREQRQNWEAMRALRRNFGIQDPDPDDDRIFGHQMDFAELPLDLETPFD